MAAHNGKLLVSKVILKALAYTVYTKKTQKNDYDWISHIIAYYRILSHSIAYYRQIPSASCDKTAQGSQLGTLSSGLEACFEHSLHLARKCKAHPTRFKEWTIIWQSFDNNEQERIWKKRWAMRVIHCGCSMLGLSSSAVTCRSHPGLNKSHLGPTWPTV